MLFLIARSHVGLVRFDPDLEEVDQLVLRRVVFAMPHARAGAHALHVPGADHRAVAHRVLVREPALEDITDDLHVAVTVRAETLARLDAVLVDDAKGAEPHVLRVLVVREGKGVEGAKPAVLGKASFLAAANLHHGRLSHSCSVALNDEGYDAPDISEIKRNLSIIFIKISE